MYRNWKVYIEDIVTAIEKIERYMEGQDLGYCSEQIDAPQNRLPESAG